MGGCEIGFLEVFFLMIQENHNAPKNFLKAEYAVYEMINQEWSLHTETVPVPVPKALDYGETKKFRVLVMELLGVSLYSLFTLCQKTFSLKTTLMLGIKMIDQIEHFHSKGLVHRFI